METKPLGTPRAADTLKEVTTIKLATPKRATTVMSTMTRLVKPSLAVAALRRTPRLSAISP